MMDECSEESGSIKNSIYGPRDSVRTIVKDGGQRRGSNLVPEPSTTEPTPAAMGMLDQSFSAHMSFMAPMAVADPMDSMAVQSWNNGVSDPNDGDIANSFPMSDQFYAPGELTPHGDLGNWGGDYYQSAFQGLGGDRFNPFDGGMN